MQIRNKKILLTGAAGGMGRLLANRLHQHGAVLALVDANEQALETVAAKLEQGHPLAGDLSTAAGCRDVIARTKDSLGEIDILINLAGLMSFCCFEEENPEFMELLLQVNLLGAMRLTRGVLPAMLARNSGQIINIGSVFGTIGFAYFTTYSASKFALRGFSEALRRELADSQVGVTYIAPRAVKTPLNTGRIMRMGAATKMNMDAPEKVVEKILQTIERDCKERYIGFPESLFARINALFPRLVDKALAGQNRLARKFAQQKNQEIT